MEDKHEEVEDIESGLSDSFIDDDDDDDSDNDDDNEPSTSGQDDGTRIQEPLTDQEVEELVAEFLEVESKAAEAQEALEKESLAKIESDVREELAQSLQGDDLEAAVEDEMATFREEWENVLDELETESYHLLEQLDGTGIELPSLYKWIESQAPNSCCTEAWKRRAHWVGTQVTKETTDTVADAEKYLQIHRPVRRRHGKLLEEGASGFLQKKLAMDGSEAIAENGEVDWASMKKLFSTSSSEDVASFGSRHWASVYLANTPQEAALMGLKFPGVNEVEEIEDIDGNSSDPFVAEAIANEKELVLSEEQRKNYRKVKEEDDAKIDQKLQLRLKQRRCLKRRKQGVSSVVQEMGTNMAESLPLDDNYHEATCQDLKKDVCENSGDLDMEQLMNESNSVFPESDASEPRRSKRPNESEDLSINNKKIRTVIIDSDNEADILEDKSVHGIKVEDQSTLLENIGDSSAGCNPSLGSSEKFQCTACDKVAVEVHSHPLLKVIVCKDCKFLMEEKMHLKDPDCSECYCGWCGRNNDLVSCKSCRTLFCTACIKRNIGEEYLYKVPVSGWQCCCCSPSLLQRLTSQLEKAMGSGDIMVSSSDSDSDSSDTNDGVTISSKRKKKKKIRRIIDDAELGEETKRKIAIEKERQERLKSLKVKFSDKSKMMNFASCSGNLPEGTSVEVIGDATTGYIVNVVREKGEEAVRIPPSLSSKLKAHQVAGIRFLWENIIQSIRKVKSGDNGLGCILAHTMGLGKTFQVIAFLYTAMRGVDLGLRTALIVTPVNVLHNWRKEFMKWTPSEVKPLRVFMLEDVSRERRVELLAKWRAKGGVFLIGYSAFRNLSLGKNVKERNMAREMCSALQDGPDILVCDEAHIIKNTRAETTQALKLVKCQRRIALTGSPLQNNLMEYYCMVDFVREGFLGSSHEFRNRFQNPIENGQHTNSTVDDVKIMNQRSHILYEQLKGFVQRMDMSVVKKDLPPKTVFVVAVKLSPLQRKLYKRFLDVHGFTNDRASNEKTSKSFFAGYQALAQIWNHPGILQLRKGREYVGNVENFLADDCSSDENVDYNTIVEEKSRNPNDFIQGKSDDGFFQKDWWNDLLLENNYKEVDYSGKMVLLLDILVMSSDVGDKTLVFTQSIPTLDLIELYLSRLPRLGKKGKFWRKGKDWYRLDGRTESSERQRLVERFNDPKNKRVKCTLISTRAGSLGINLYAANRVVIVDGSWNPTYDLQAIYRAWRYGQTKPVFAYRLMAHGTMEEKIYKRQVTKEGLAARVVDRQQVYRTISREEMLHLFEFGDDENSDTLIDIGQEYRQADTRNISCQTANSLKQNASRSHGSCASDKVMESLLGKHRQRWNKNSVRNMGSLPKSTKAHAVCVPYPAQGHIAPMLKVAKLLHHKGFHITFVNSEYNHRRLLKSGGRNSLDVLPDFQFETIPDGLGDQLDANVTQDISFLCDSTSKACLDPFRQLLAKLNSSNVVPPVTCIVADSGMSFALDVKEELQIPVVTFWTSSACGTLGYAHYKHLVERGYTPLKEESDLTNGYLETKIDWIPGMKDIRLKDLPTFIRTTDRNDVMLNFVIRVIDRASKASAALLNTFDDLDHDVLVALSSMFPPIYSVGPLNLLLDQTQNDYLASIGSSLWKEETECLHWLDSKDPNSVVYVNFGSITVMNPQQLEEFSWGLASSKKNFLWIIRPDLVRGESAVLPPEFLEETRERGLMASWCAQEKVLKHSSIGGFLSHMGWNSTIESLSNGVPMLCWPFFSEQQTNCKFACVDWGVGMEIESDANRDEVEKLVIELIDGEKGKEMKRKAMEWKSKAEATTGVNGSSSMNFDKLVDDVLRFQKP